MCCLPPAPLCVGRIEMELFSDLCPKTSENFLKLCTGTSGIGEAGKPLHFEGSPLHRIIEGFMAQGGDITRGDGSGGESVWGKKFNDEKEGLKLKHEARGQLSMANSGKNSNSSQFFITFGPAPSLNGKHVVFGKVVAGLDILECIEMSAASKTGLPKQAVWISKSGSCPG